MFVLFLCRFSRVEVIAKALPISAYPRTRVKACWKGARGLGLVPCRAQRALSSLRDGFANADHCVLAIEQHASKAPGLRVIMEDERLREQPFRKVKDRRWMLAASVFGTVVPALLLVLAVPPAASIRGNPMFFAKHSCHRWRTAGVASACAHHF
jgi:hypothetical protein